MRNAGGQATIFGGEGIVNFDGRWRAEVRSECYTVDSFTCTHCGRVEHVPHKPDVNHVGFCRNCMKPICFECSGKPCLPYEKQLAMIERSVETRRMLDEMLYGR